MSPVADRTAAFCEAFGLRVLILMAPMAGACPVALAAAVADAGGMGGCGALLMTPQGIADWVGSARARTNGALQVNLWVPDPDPRRDADHERELAFFLSAFGPEPPVPDKGPFVQDFDAQFQAVLEAGAGVFSTIMRLLTPEQAGALRARGIRWLATVTTRAEAVAAEAAGADAVIAQGAEAGGHRGAFDASHAAERAIGGMALIPAVADAVSVPVIAAGGIADGRAMAAALVLGASAVIVGSALLRSPEAATAPAWANAMAGAAPEDTVLTRAFSGRAGRALRNAYVDAAATGPEPAPYPVQRALTQAMRDAAARDGRFDAMQGWTGQAAGRARGEPAAVIVEQMWAEACAILGIQASAR